MVEDTLIGEDTLPVYVSVGMTDVGHRRKSNQDAFLERSDAGLWAVADGMGGHSDGDVASRMVCEALAQVERAATLEGTIDAIRQSLSEVNRRLHCAAVRPKNPVFSGSTVALFLASRTACAILWAGDSRVYRLRHGCLTQLTTDHTWAAELNLQNSGTEADHAITRAVGGEASLVLDVHRDQVHLGDRYLVCSDGLTHEVDDERIATLLCEADVAECARRLLEATLQAGARDNVTVIVIEAA